MSNDDEPPTLFDQEAKPLNRPLGRPETLTGGKDSATQKAGAARGAGKAGTRRRETFDVIRRSGPDGIAFSDLCARLHREYSHVGPRVRELRKDGLVERLPYTRTNPATGAQQDVYRVTFKGISEK